MWVDGLFISYGTGLDDGEDVEIPWWTYGARGMQLWFPKKLAEPMSHAAAAEEAHYMTDPELEFDKEVYPISISLAEVSIIGERLPTIYLLPEICPRQVVPIERSELRLPPG